MNQDSASGMFAFDAAQDDAFDQDALDYRHLMGFVALLIVLLCSCRAPDAPTEMAMGNAPPAEVMAAAAIAQGDLPDAARPHDASRVRDFAGVTAQHDPAVLPASDQSPDDDDAPAAAPVSDSQSGAHPVATASYHAVGLPPEAFTGRPGDGYTVPGKVPAHMREVMGLPAPEMHTPEMLGTGPMPQSGAFCTDGQCPPHMVYGDQLPRPIGGCGPWKPPGIAGPWPADEYIFDGGDQDGGVKVRDDWSLAGLGPEDTVAHYDTLDGRTVVKPTNRVCIYSPRFASVRQVSLAHGDNQLVRAGGVERPESIVRQDEVQPVTTALQPVQPVAKIGERATITFLDKVPAAGLDAELVAWAVQDRYKPYEDFDIIRRGILEEAEKPFLAVSVDAAIQWTADQGVQVTIDGRKASVLEGDQKAQAVFRVDLPDNPCLRVCKVASTPSAKPGEIVEFTLRFDNVGDQTIGNVTLVDNLTTRLELIPGSGQASVKADFFTEPNQQGSLILRWEITEPLKPGEGGIARFKCRVR